MADRDDALSGLGAWHAQQPWARLPPDRLSLASAQNVGPLEVLLWTRFEHRGVAYELQPAPRRDPSKATPPDPWAYPLAQPSDAPVGHTQKLPLGGHPLPLNCSECSGTGDVRCRHCDGRGQVGHGKRAHACPVCGGRSVVVCDACRSTGTLLGAPTVWSRIGMAEDRRTSDNPDLPNEVAIDLADSKVPSQVIARVDAERVDASALGADVPAAARTNADALVLAPSIPEGARVLRQTLEVRRMSVYAIRLASGAELHLWGAPPKVHPRSAASSALGRLLPFLAR